jgi:2-polyprenyl-6-methoxyphenol hydroxylase-like FAD-dependent oxidoreductase
MAKKTLKGLKVGIVGASVAGLATARFLRERGAEVRVFERSRARLEARGGGIAMDPNVVPLVGSLRGRSVEGRIVIGASGQALWTKPVRKWMTAWSEVYGALHAHVPEAVIRRGHTVECCESLNQCAVVQFSQQPPERFDFVVGADGLGSVVRQAVAPGFEPEYAGYVAIRGHVEEKSLPARCDRLRQWADSPGLVNCYGPRTHLVAYWSPGAAGKVLNWMWYRNVDCRDLAGFMSDAKGQPHHWSLAPGMLPEDRRNGLLQELAEIMPAAFSAAAAATKNLYLQAIYKGLPDRMARDRLILVGDAAHVSLPHIGAGSSFAVQDAASLAEAMDSEDPEKVLASWATERRESTWRDLVGAARLGHALQHEDHDWEHWKPGDFDKWWAQLVGRRRLYFDRENGS